MNCPYCDGAMMKGYLWGGDGVIRFSESDRPFLRLGKEFGITSPNPFKKPPKAQYCPACRKIILDVEKEYS